jgi:hypothetical protein
LNGGFDQGLLMIERGGQTLCFVSADFMAWGGDSLYFYFSDS